jgi:serine/threonine protein phosphatase 1
MPFVERFEQNTVGRDFAVGDIHGCYRRLDSALVTLGFDETVDRLFSVGDLVDRGQQNEEATVYVEEKPWFHAVVGNHDDLAIRLAENVIDIIRYYKGGGEWNIQNTQEERDRIKDVFNTLPFAIEVQTEGGIVGIVHADCPFPTWAQFIESLDDPKNTTLSYHSSKHAAIWSRDRIKWLDTTIVPDIRAIIVGHSIVNEPVVLGNVHYIDTGAWHSDGCFTFINLATLETTSVR